jgi:hypothetical protein
LATRESQKGQKRSGGRIAPSDEGQTRRRAGAASIGVMSVLARIFVATFGNLRPLRSHDPPKGKSQERPFNIEGLRLQVALIREFLQINSNA